MFYVIYSIEKQKQNPENRGPALGLSVQDYSEVTVPAEASEEPVQRGPLPVTSWPVEASQRGQGRVFWRHSSD